MQFLRYVVAFVFTMIIAACSAETGSNAPGTPASMQDTSEVAAGAEDQSSMGVESAHATSNGVDAVKSRLAFLPWITGSYAAGDTTSKYIAFIDDGMPVAVFEQQDLGDYGENRVAHYYDNGQLIGFEKWSRILSAAGAPSDGWYESETVVIIENGRFAGGLKTVNGKPSEPDEHEIRGAGRAGAEMKARVAAVLRGDAPADQEGPQTLLVVRGVLDAGEEITLPENTIARVQIRDTAKQDIAAEVLTGEDIPLSRLPADFTLTAPRALIAPHAQLSVFVQVVSRDDLLYITAARVPIDPAQPSGGITAKLTKVAVFNPSETAPGTGAGGMTITPPQDAYDCAGERILVAVEAGGAFVTFADRTSLRLPLLPVETEGRVKTFTNGKATVLVTKSPDGESIVQFARGRAIPAPCTRP